MSQTWVTNAPVDFTLAEAAPQTLQRPLYTNTCASCRAHITIDGPIIQPKLVAEVTRRLSKGVRVCPFCGADFKKNWEPKDRPWNVPSDGGPSLS